MKEGLSATVLKHTTNCGGQLKHALTRRVGVYCGLLYVHLPSELPLGTNRKATASVRIHICAQICMLLSLPSFHHPG
jgi:hypothetical protein